MKKLILVFFLYSSLSFSQTTYVITNPQGFTTGTVQVQGNQAQVVNNQGYVTNNLTIYPNQIVNTQSWAIGTPSYTVPPSPPSPPSPRVLQ